jgi:hypothetical protein
VKAKGRAFNPGTVKFAILEVAMWKTVAAGIAALAIAGGSMVYAQQRGDAGQHHHQMSAQDIGAYTDARIAALKAGLQLTAEQEKNWPALEKALRDGAKARSERFAARASADKPLDPVERLRLRAETMSQHGASLKQIADAAAPLYQSLDDAQKRRFSVLAQLDGGRTGEHHYWRHHRRGGDHEMMHHGAGTDAPQPKQQ